MAKNIKSIQELVTKLVTNLPKIKKDAENSNSEACFQMGLSHLLGVNTPVDFKKASQYFKNRSLVDNSEASRLLGFIAECEGNYSFAFQNYAKAAGGLGDEANISYIDKAIKERGNLQDYFRKLDLPIVLNNEISAILGDYTKGGESQLDACHKIAFLCNDQQSCTLVAQGLYEVGDFMSASQWLRKGKVPNNNPLYVAIEKNMERISRELRLPSSMEIVEVEGNALLADINATSSYEQTKNICDEASSSNTQLWIDQVSNKIIKNITQQLGEEEEHRKKEEEKRKGKLAWDILLISAYIIFLTVIYNRVVDEEAYGLGLIISELIFTLGPFLFIRWLIRRSINNKYR